MAVKGLPPAIDRSERLAQIDRLVSSSVLHGSEALCKLLRYLAEHALTHPATSLKEYQIAIEAFGRSADFDPQSDATVRVHAGRLRSKLEEYYRSQGVEDPVLVELPKGGYALSFHARPRLPDRPAMKPPIEPVPAIGHRRWVVAVVLLSVLLTAAIAANIFLLARRTSPPPPPGEVVPAALRAFWKPFLSAPEDPWVIFSNAVFVGRPETGMRYFDSARDSRDVILDHYTGVGEVLAVHALDRAFGLMRRTLHVKRGRLLSLDDAQNNNLIFVGSPAENLTLLDLPATQEFAFQRLAAAPHKGELAIVNRHPQPGEPEFFLSSSPSRPHPGLRRGCPNAGPEPLALRLNPRRRNHARYPGGGGICLWTGQPGGVAIAGHRL
ncbi:MAG: hypothetical protein ABSH49_36090 [Bryobacteraceae bacterium]|jgi:hypothetical protein